MRQAQYGGTQPRSGWLLEYGVDQQGRRKSVSDRNLFDNFHEVDDLLDLSALIYDEYDFLIL